MSPESLPSDVAAFIGDHLLSLDEIEVLTAMRDLPDRWWDPKLIYAELGIPVASARGLPACSTSPTPSGCGTKMGIAEAIRVVAFLQAVSATAAWISAQMFLRCWRDTRDTLFMMFALAFTLMGVSWAMLSAFNPTADASPHVYGLRLLAFLLIIGAVVVKNRETIR